MIVRVARVDTGRLARARRVVRATTRPVSTRDARLARVDGVARSRNDASVSNSTVTTIRAASRDAVDAPCVAR